MGRVAAMSEGQFRMAAVRLLESATVVLLAVAALELWGGYQFGAQQADPLTGELRADAFSWARLGEAVLFFAFRGPISLLVAGVLLIGIAALLATRGTVANASVLRWEAAALGSVTALFTLFHLLAGAIALLTVQQSTGAPFDSRVQQSASLGWPLAGLALLALFFLWWARLAEHLRDGGSDRGAEDARGVREVPGARGVRGVRGVREAPGARGARGAREDEATDAAARSDEEVATGGVGGVEQPAGAEGTPSAERLSPDGSTANGFDEYFRRG